MNKLSPTFPFSFSSVNNYLQCQYQFKLTYLDKVPRGSSFWSEYGSFCHLVLEKYFKKELDIFELSEYYRDNYYNSIKTPPPGFMKNIDRDYFQTGLYFFNNFSFDRDEYEILNIEKLIKGKYKDINYSMKPDLILTNKETSETILLDYKTASPMKGDKFDEKKIAEYKRQMHLYSWFLWNSKNIVIQKIKLWFIRDDKMIEWDYDALNEVGAIGEFLDNANKIKNHEGDWIANNKNKFYCQQICSVSSFCPFKP